MTSSQYRVLDGGYILISVLSVCALLSGLVVAMLLLGRTAGDTVRAQNGAMVDDALAMSAVNLAGFELFVLKHDAASVNGRQLRMDQGVVRILVSSDAGKVDLNGAGKSLLAAAYRASGLTAMTPEVFAAHVIDWRDGDDEVQKDGAEAQAYASAGIASGPRNAPFRSVSDLQYVLGVSAGDVSSLQQFLTVFNAPGRLSAFFAHPALISALPGVQAETAMQVRMLRDVGNEINTAKIADLLLVQSALIDVALPRTYSLIVETRRTTGNIHQTIAVVIAAGATPNRPYEVLHWSVISPPSAPMR